MDIADYTPYKSHTKRARCVPIMRKCPIKATKMAT